jgi:RecA/RadA recombinase
MSTGSFSLDKALNGGLKQSTIALIYGEAETGKTTLAMQCAINLARMDYKTFFVDCDGTFSPERLKQLASKDSEGVFEKIIIIKPLTFTEQATLIDNLEKYVNQRFGLLVFDTITSLYRSEFNGKEELYRLNRELNFQIATVKKIAATLEIPVLFISQVKDIPSLGEINTEPVATRVLKFWSKIEINLTHERQEKLIKLTIKQKDGNEEIFAFYLKLDKKGLLDYEKQLPF